MKQDTVSEECVMAMFTLIAEALFRAGVRDPLENGARLTARVVGLVEQHLPEEPRPLPEPSLN